MKTTFLLSITFLFSSLSFAQETTPFTDILFDSAPSVKVQVNGELYYLLAVDGVRRETLIEKCTELYGADCSCMFAEKFTETMSAVGTPVSSTVNLQLYKMETHAVSSADVALTVEAQDELVINREMRGERCYY